uniref:Protein cycle n=1 Tax=Cacopsylla melanoneura TaxID=428564 RepID=A0A8D8XS95_9HEMI
MRQPSSSGSPTPSTCSTSTYVEEGHTPSSSIHPMEYQQADSTRKSKKRKGGSSFHGSDFEEDTGEDSGKSLKLDDSKKQNHSEIEKRRRDKMNTYITELSAMVPMCHAMSRKLDKLTVLRMAVQHLKTIRGAVHSYTEGHYKPAFLTDQELKHLILQAAEGFLFVVDCDRGRILYVSESVSQILHYSQGELLGQSWFDILHPKDVAKVKEQLFSSDLSPRERLIDVKTLLPVKTDIPAEVSRLCPGARRSFFCRMKCKQSASSTTTTPSGGSVAPSAPGAQSPGSCVKEEPDTTTGAASSCHRSKKKQQQSSGSPPSPPLSPSSWESLKEQCAIPLSPLVSQECEEECVIPPDSNLGASSVSQNLEEQVFNPPDLNSESSSVSDIFQEKYRIPPPSTSSGSGTPSPGSKRNSGAPSPGSEGNSESSDPWSSLCSNFADRKYSVIQCTGYLKSWAPAKMGLEESEEGEGGETCTLSCLVAVGRVLAPADKARILNKQVNLRPVQFLSRHALDGKFLFIDQRATPVLGFLPQELLGTSMYEYFHHKDIAHLAESHKSALQNSSPVTTSVYQFKNKGGAYVQLQSEWKNFRNPWTKDIEYLISKNTLILNEMKAESSSDDPSQSQLTSGFDFFNTNQSNSMGGKEMQRLITSHVEASKIGRQIAEAVLDMQRRETSSSNSTPSPTNAAETLTDLLQNHGLETRGGNPLICSPLLGGSDVERSGDFSLVRNNVILTSSSCHESGDQDDVMSDMISPPSPQSGGVPTAGNDEAAMAVIMSLLEADAGLGGPVDFSGLPWPLP